MPEVPLVPAVPLVPDVLLVPVVPTELVVLLPLSVAADVEELTWPEVPADDVDVGVVLDVVS